MPKQRLVLIMLCLVLVAGLSLACRRQPATPTPTPLPTPTEIATPLPTEAAQPVDPAVIDWPPQVVYSSPAPGEESLLDGAITIRFDQPMDRASVEKALQVQGVDSAESAAGAFTWPRPDTVIFTPAEKLQREQRYRVQVSADARSAKGQRLVAPVMLDIQTVGYLQVAQVIPADGSQQTQVDGAVTLLFNRPVVPLVGTNQQAGLPQPLTFDPPVTGAGEWVSTSIYRFTPDVAFAGATTYQVSVAAGLEDITGGVLKEPFTWRFATADPSVILFEPPDGTSPFDPQGTLTITFNMPMDRAATETAISLAPTAPLAFAWSDDSHRVSVTPQTRLALETRYQLTVSQAARSANGQATLKAAASAAFTTYPFPRVESTYPERNVVADYFDNVSVNFASPMDPATLDGRVTIEPAPTKLTYYLDPGGFYMSLNVQLARNTLYTVTIPGSAADIYGNQMGQAYVWSFRTADYMPIASLNVPGPVSQMSTSFPTQVDILQRKVSSIAVQLFNFDQTLPVSYLNANGYYEELSPTGLVREWALPADPNSIQAAAINLPLADGGVLPTGVYYLTLSAPELNPDSRWWQNQRHLLIVADTNLTVKETPDYIHVWATNLASGQPSAGLTVTFYQGENAVGAAVTDANGLARQAKPTPRTQDYYSTTAMVVSNAPGQAGFGVGRTGWSAGVSPWQFGLSYAGLFADPLTWYLFTDRPIYRPGDTVFFRGYVRSAEFGRYALPTDVKNVKVTLAGSNYYEDQKPLELEAPVDDNGGFSGEFAIPTGALLGNYGLFVTTAPADPNAGYGVNPVNITVAEYRKPEFLVTVSAEKSDVLRGDSADFTVEAAYFFGGPAGDLKVAWNIYQTPYVLPWEGPYYNFSQDDYPFYYVEGSFGSNGYYGGAVASGEGVTDSQGQLKVTLPAGALDAVADGSRRLTFEATIFDLSDFPVAARTDVIAHQAEIYAGVAPTNYLSAVDRETGVNLITVGWDQQPVGNVAYEVVFYQREWRSQRDKGNFGGYTTFWEPVDTEVARDRGVTAADGRGVARFTPTDGGSYVAKLTAADQAGRAFHSNTFLYVVSADYAGWRSDARDRRMDLTADKKEYVTGEAARILVQSPFSGPVQAWVVVERGNVIEQRLVTLSSASDVLTLPITPAYAPNVFVTVAAVKGVDDSSFPYADIRLGMTELVVKPDAFSLNIQVTPDHEQYGPRDTVTYDIRVTDAAGQPVQADLSLSLVDLAVLTLKPDNATPILQTFYARQALYSETGGGLFVSGEGLPVEEPLQAFGGGGGGGGGADEIAPALRDREAEADVRQDFRDTAYWSARVTTGADGRATALVTLPDNLTTWRLSAKAVSLPGGNLQVGQTTRDIIATRPVLIRPITPRFFTVGDRVQLGAIVNNNTGDELAATVLLEAEGVTLEDSAETALTLPAHGSRLVRWPVRVQDVNAADLTFRVTAGAYSDASKPTVGNRPDRLLPVYRYNAQDIVGTSGVLDEDMRRVEALLLPPSLDPSLGSLDIRLSPSLGAAVLDTLTAVNETYAEDCSYWLADQLLPNAATASAVRRLGLAEPALLEQLDQLIPAHMARLGERQLTDGGWSWCNDAESIPFITAYVLLALANGEQAGYPAVADVMARGRAYLQAQLTPVTALNTASLVNRQAFYLYVLAEAGAGARDQMDALLAAHRDLLDPYAQALFILAYDAIGGEPDQTPLLNDLDAEAIVSATGAHWEDAQQDFDNLSSDVRGTAMVLLALARVNPDNPFASNAARWLMAARQAVRWPTSHETAWSLLALTEWMAATGELDANYAYQLAVNRELLTEGTFTRENVLDSAEWPVSLNQLFPDAVNFLDFQRTAGPGRLYYTAHLNAFVSADSVSAVNRGLIVQRAYYAAACQPEKETCEPLTSIQAGQAVRVQLTIIAPHNLTYVTVEDPLPAGADAVDPNLETATSGSQVGVTRDDYRWGYWGWWVFDPIQFRDEKVVFTTSYLPAGTYQYTYTLQPSIPGDYQVMPTLARQVFFPEVFGRSDGLLFTITPSR